MNPKKLIPIVLAAVVACALGSASSTSAAPKPGFPSGTWIGNGQMFAETGFDGDLITSMSGSSSFKLKVSKSGKVTGSGTYTVLQTGDGPVASKITGVARITFSGTATDVRYVGKQVVTMKFGDAVHSNGNTITRNVSGKLTITKARSCRVSGGHLVPGGGTGSPWIKFVWKATLQGVKCP
jgi:hypothetical protein